MRPKSGLRRHEWRLASKRKPWRNTIRRVCWPVLCPSLSCELRSMSHEQAIACIAYVVTVPSRSSSRSSSWRLDMYGCSCAASYGRRGHPLISPTKQTRSSWPTYRNQRYLRPSQANSKPTTKNKSISRRPPCISAPIPSRGQNISLSPSSQLVRTRHPASQQCVA